MSEQPEQHSPLMWGVALLAGIYVFTRLEKIMADTTKLSAEIADLKTTVGEAVSYIKGLADKIVAASAADDSDAISAAVTEIHATTDALKAAIAPPSAAPTEPPAPVDTPVDTPVDPQAAVDTPVDPQAAP